MSVLTRLQSLDDQPTQGGVSTSTGNSTVLDRLQFASGEKQPVVPPQPEQPKTNWFSDLWTNIKKETGGMLENVWTGFKQDYGEVKQNLPQAIDKTLKVAEDAYLNFPSIFPNPKGGLQITSYKEYEKQLPLADQKMIQDYWKNPVDWYINMTRDALTTHPKAIEVLAKAQTFIEKGEYVNPLTKQVVPLGLNKNPVATGIVKGIGETWLGSSQNVRDALDTQLVQPVDFGGTALQTVGQVIGQVMSLVAGGAILKAAGVIKLAYPILFATIGQTSAMPDTTIAQRLEKIPVDALAGYIFSKIPPLKDGGLTSANVQQLLKNAGLLALGGMEQGGLTALIEGKNEEEAVKRGATQAVITGLFYVVASSMNLLTDQLLASKIKAGVATFTPDQVKTMVANSKYEGTKIGNDLIAKANEAMAQGKNIELDMKQVNQGLLYDKLKMNSIRLETTSTFEQKAGGIGQKVEVKTAKQVAGVLTIQTKLVDTAPNLPSGTAITKPQTAAEFEVAEGWPPGIKSKFDYALRSKDMVTVKELLPLVPADYKIRFAPKIANVAGEGAGYMANLSPQIQKIRMGMGMLTGAKIARLQEELAKLPPEQQPVVPAENSPTGKELTGTDAYQVLTGEMVAPLKLEITPDQLTNLTVPKANEPLPVEAKLPEGFTQATEFVPNTEVAALVQPGATVELNNKAVAITTPQVVTGTLKTTTDRRGTYIETADGRKISTGFRMFGKQTESVVQKPISREKATTGAFTQNIIEIPAELQSLAEVARATPTMPQFVADSIWSRSLGGKVDAALAKFPGESKADQLENFYNQVTKKPETKPTAKEAAKQIEKPKEKTKKVEEFKVGDVLNPQGKTNMVGKVTIREISGNTLKFIDEKGTEFSGMQKSLVRDLINGGSWKRVSQPEPTTSIAKATEIVPKTPAKPVTKPKTVKAGKVTPDRLYNVLTKNAARQLPSLAGVWVKDGKMVFTDPETEVVLNTTKPDAFYKVVGKELVKIDDIAYRAEDLPALTKQPKDLTAEVLPDGFQKLLNQAKNFVSPDEGRPILNGVRLEFKKTHFSLTATDGFSLYYKRGGSQVTTDGAFTVGSPKTIGFALGAFQGEKLDVKVDKENISFSNSLGSITSRLLIGEFPEIARIYPTFSTRIRVDYAKLANAIESLKPYVKDTGNHINLSIGKNEIVLSGQDVDKLKKEITLPADFKDIAIPEGSLLEGVLIMPVAPSKEENLGTNTTKLNISFLEKAIKVGETEDVYLDFGAAKEIKQGEETMMRQSAVHVSDKPETPVEISPTQPKGVSQAGLYNVYHGTNDTFTNFDNSMLGKNTGANPKNQSALGHWFTDNATSAKDYGKNVIETRLNISKPKVYSSEEFSKMRSSGMDFAKLRQDLMGQGYDGVVVKPGSVKFDNRMIKVPGEYAVFEGKNVAQQPLSVSKGVGGGTPSGYASIDKFAEVKKVAESLTNFRAIEFPELLRMVKEIMGATPSVSYPRFRPTMGGRPNGFFVPKEGGAIVLNPDIFADPAQAVKTFAHEIGHLVDYLPDYMMKRGNLLGHLLTLTRNLKQTFGDLKNKELKAELMVVTRMWRPFDENEVGGGYLKYRNSNTELYADAISVLLNDPDTLKQMAPKFWDAFFQYLDAKPEVKTNYFNLLDLLNKGEEAVLSEREKSIREMFSKGEDLVKVKTLERSQRNRDFVFRLKYELIDKNQRIIDKVNQAKKENKFVPDEKNPVYWLEGMNYLGGLVKDFVQTNVQPIYHDIMNNGLTWEDFGEVLFLERVMNERGELANPLGFTPETAQKQIDYLKTQLGSRYAVIERNLPKYRTMVKSVLDDAEKAGIFKPELVAEMKTNPAYATYQVLDYLDLYIPAAVKHQIGTLKEISNPATATIIKTISIIRATERNKVKTSIVDFMQKNFADEIKPAKTMWTGKTKIPMDSKEPDEALFALMEEGKYVGYYVDPYIQKTMEGMSVGQGNAVLSVFKFMNSKLYRPLFITFNLGFQSFNLIRDFMRYFKNSPNLNLFQAVRGYKNAVPVAYHRAWDIPDTTLSEMAQSKLLGVTYNDIAAGMSDEDKQIDLIMKKIDLSPFREKKVNFFIKPFLAILDGIERLGNLVETLPKVAAWRELNGKMPPQELASFIRTSVGSPDFLRRGAGYGWYNEVFLFSNAIKEGMRADYNVAFTNPKTRSGYWFKTALLTFLPKILMYAALAGVFGVAIRKMMQDASEYDRTNYTIVPLGENEAGQTTYLRIPQDETGRLLGGILWKTFVAGTDKKLSFSDLTNILSFTGGQLPTINPTIDLILANAQYLAGQNPYDFFRARNVIPDTEFKAGGTYALKPFLTWQLNQVGGGVFWKGYTILQAPDTKTWIQKVVETPLVSNIVGRWIKVSDYGQTEANKTIITDITKEKAVKSLETRAAVDKYVKLYQEQKPGIFGRKELERQLVTEVLGHYPAKGTAEKTTSTNTIKKFQVGILRGQADTHMNSLIDAPTNAAKVELLVEYKNQLSEAELTALIKLAKDNKVISSNVVKDFEKLR